MSWQETQWNVNRVYLSLLFIHYTDTPLDFSSPSAQIAPLAKVERSDSWAIDPDSVIFIKISMSLKQSFRQVLLIFVMLLYRSSLYPASPVFSKLEPLTILISAGSNS
jgi:hypothetical protein